MPVSLVKTKDDIYTLDVRSYTCPYPEFYTVRALKQLSAGESLEVILDNPPSCDTIPIAAQKQGCKMIEVTKLSDILWKIRIQK